MQKYSPDQVEKAQQQYKQNPMFLIRSQNNITQVSLDCIERITIDLPRSQFDDQCSICNDTWASILFTNEEKIILLQCKHIFCQKDFCFQSLQGKCPICRSNIYIAFELVFDHIYDNCNAFVLKIADVIRFNVEYHRSITCTQNQCNQPAMFVCSICFDQSKAICGNCISDQSWVEYARTKFLRSIFYCGCEANNRLLQIKQREPHKLEQLIALNSADSKQYGHLLAEELKSLLIEQKKNNSQIFCILCPEKTFTAKWELNRHFHDSHFEIYSALNANLKKCEYCQKTYANQNKLDKHKCKKLCF